MDARHRRSRKRLGSYYTPAATARALTRLALEDLACTARIADPACGDGVFLEAAADVLLAKGASVESILTAQLFGADVDPVAVAATMARLADWAARNGASGIAPPGTHLVVGDALDASSGPSWLSSRGSVDGVVGNPPFGSQLRSLTATSRDRRNQLAEQFGVSGLGYADTAGLFLIRSFDLVRAGGVVTLILPTSLLAARDATFLRESVARRSTLTALWAGGDAVGFDASIAVWAPILRVGSGRSSNRPVRRFVGPEVVEVDAIDGASNRSNWAGLIADLAGGPAGATVECLDLAEGCLGTHAQLTAGFRRHFYGLVPFVRDDSDPPSGLPRLVTTGSIDPLRHREDVPVRFAGNRFRLPVVDVEALGRDAPQLGAWCTSMMVPKVLVASQGKVLEVIIDTVGNLIPSTPVIAVVPNDGIDVAHLAALITGPVAAAILHRRAAGSGLAWGQCRVSGAFLRDLPCPIDRNAWDVAANKALQATGASASGDPVAWNVALDELAVAMTLAYGLKADDPIVDWWKMQRPPWRGVEALIR